MGEEAGEDGVRHVAVDGKALRRSFSRASETSPLHLAGAFAPASGLVLGQAAVDGKSNEIRALPTLLDPLDLKGAVAAADAMHAQRVASERIIGKGGTYVPALKGNRGSLRRDAKEQLDDPEEAENMLSHQELGCGRGRRDGAATVSHDADRLQDPADGRVSRRSEKSRRSGRRKGGPRSKPAASS